MTIVRPEIDYETLAHDAMRGMVRTVLQGVAKSGLPGEHHFYISFKTQAPNVMLSKRLLQKYPEEMTIVLQHQYTNLSVGEERFDVTLKFDGIPERLSIPFASIKVFFDPSVPFGHQFETGDPAEQSASKKQADAPAARPAAPASKPTPMRRAPIAAVVSDEGAENSRKTATATQNMNANTAKRPPKHSRNDAEHFAEGEGTKPGTPAIAATSAGVIADQAAMASLPAPQAPGADQSPDLPINEAKVVKLDAFRKK